MNKLSQSEIEFITRCLNEGKPLPDSYRCTVPSKELAQSQILR